MITGIRYTCSCGHTLKGAPTSKGELYCARCFGWVKDFSGALEYVLTVGVN